MMVFRNWFNKQHSKDTSKKVGSGKKMCAQGGKYMGTYAPYGFRKDPKDKHRFVIDGNTAPIVRKIFELRLEGKGYKAIANYLNEAGIIPPREYYYQERNGENPLRVNHCWCDATIKVILANEAYIGNLVQSKVGTVSYKSHKTVAKPKDEWIRAEGTHEAIIDRETWDRAQKIGEKRYQPKPKKDGAASVFSGLLVCADCGFKMRIHHKNRTRLDGSEYRRTSFLCGNYARSGKAAPFPMPHGEFYGFFRGFFRLLRRFLRRRRCLLHAVKVALPERFCIIPFDFPLVPSLFYRVRVGKLRVKP